MSQINARHYFLARFIGTQDREDISYSKASEVNLLVTVTTCVCCLLEIALYFVYNKMVNNVCKYVLFNIYIYIYFNIYIYIHISRSGEK